MRRSLKFGRIWQRPTGFTVVELLVVIAIIGAMVGILLPAVGGARARARRMQNENNVKNIGLAVQSYEQAKSSLPPLVKYPTGTKDLPKAVSWAFELLPYLEEGNIYDKFNPSFNCSNSHNQVAMATPIEVYASPQRRDSAAICKFLTPGEITGTLLDYAANGGVIMDDHEQPIKLSNAPPSTGKVLETAPYKNKFDARYSGPFHPDLAVPLAAVRDGLGNTLSIGDRWVSPLPTSQSAWSDLAGLAGESVPSLIRYANSDSNSIAGLVFPPDKTETSIFKFGNVTGGEACFAFLDAHVKWIQYSIDPLVFQRLAAIHDGNPIPPLD